MKGYYITSTFYIEGRLPEKVLYQEKAFYLPHLVKVVEVDPCFEPVPIGMVDPRVFIKYLSGSEQAKFKEKKIFYIKYDISVNAYLQGSSYIQYKYITEKKCIGLFHQEFCKMSSPMHRPVLPCNIPTEECRIREDIFKKYDEIIDPGESFIDHHLQSHVEFNLPDSWRKASFQSVELRYVIKKES